MLTEMTIYDKRSSISSSSNEAYSSIYTLQTVHCSKYYNIYKCIQCSASYHMNSEFGTWPPHEI